MNWEIAAAIFSILLAIGAIVGLFIKCGKLLQIIENLKDSVEENKEKSIASDKAQYEKIHNNKVDIEEKLGNTEQSLISKIKDAEKATSDVKFELDSFKWDITTHLLESLKANMSELVAKEIEKLSEKTDSDLASLADNWESSKDTLEDKIDKLEKKIENIEYKDIRPIKETIAELKQQLKDK